MWSDYLRDEAGSATLEFVVWIPLFLLLLLVSVDVSSFYMSQTQMLNVSRDAARRMSVGTIDGAGLDTYVKSNLFGEGYTVQNCSDTVNSCVRIERTARATLVFGTWIDSLIDGNFFVQTVTPFEPEPA